MHRRHIKVTSPVFGEKQFVGAMDE